MRRYLVLSLAGLLVGCEAVFGPPPTPTATPAFPTLVASPTINPLPPTPYDGDVFLPSNATAAARPANSDSLPEANATLAAAVDPNKPALITISAPMGNLPAEFYPSHTSPAPVIVLISMQRDNWEGTPVLLRDAGYNVLSVEARIPALEGDFAAILTSATTLQGGVAERVAVIGAAAGADVALAGCAADPRCHTVVLISPQQASPLISAMSTYNPRSLLLLVSQDDTVSLQTAEALRQTAQGQVSLQTAAGNASGTQLLAGQPHLLDIITGWLAVTLAAS